MERFRRGGIPLTLLAFLASAGVVAPDPVDVPAVTTRVVALHSSRLATASEVDLGAPAEMVAVEFRGTVDAAVEVSVAGRPGVRLEANPDEGPDGGDGRTVVGPFWIGRDVRRMRMRVVEGEGPIKVHAIDSPPERRRLTTIEEARALTPQPGIISRAAWGADESWRTASAGCDGEPDYASRVRNAFIHHTDTANSYSSADVPSIIRGIYNFHVFGRGWCDIGYNFLIDKFGRIYEGRAGGVGEAVIGAHSGGFNTASTGVALIGDHTVGGVSAAALSETRSLLAWKFAHHGIDAGRQIEVTSAGSTRYQEGTVVALHTISGHRDVSLTACPGDLAYPHIPKLRVDVQRAVMAFAPIPLPKWSPRSASSSVVVLDAYGGVHPAGGASAVTHTAFWGGWAIARGVVGTGPSGGYVADGWGGVHAFGDAPVVSQTAYWRGWDIIRGIARGPAPGAGYIVDGWGGVHAFGSAPPMPSTAYWQGWDIIRGFVANATGTGGYILDGWGGVHAVGTAPRVQTERYWQGWDIARGIAIRSDGRSGYVVDAWGGVHSFGGAPPVTSSLYAPGRDYARGIVLAQDGTGGWVVDADGGLWPFGSASAITVSLTWTGTDLGRGATVLPTSTATGL